MNRMLLVILFIAVLPQSAHAGHGTLYETDSQIFVEYEGDANEIKAIDTARENDQKIKAREESAKAKEAERVTAFTEKHIKDKEERRAKFNAGNED